MFQIFLKKKLLAGRSASTMSRHPGRARNRRLFERFMVDSRHLTVTSDQEILVIREISAKGFSSDVSVRAFDRMQIGDVYEARMRHLKDLFNMQVKVTWKKPHVVGFELVNATPETLRFMRRLLRPIELAHSLKEVDAEFVRGEPGKVWFHGDNETDLFLWRNPDNTLKAWQLRSGFEYVEWKADEGTVTGVIRVPKQSENSGLTQSEPVLVKDPLVNSHRRQFAADLITALEISCREELLATIMR